MYTDDCFEKLIERFQTTCEEMGRLREQYASACAIIEARSRRIGELERQVDTQQALIEAHNAQIALMEKKDAAAA